MVTFVTLWTLESGEQIHASLGLISQDKSAAALITATDKKA